MKCENWDWLIVYEVYKRPEYLVIKVIDVVE